MTAVEDYFSSLDASARAAFEHIRDLVMEMAPEAEQGTSYGMAALQYDQKPLLAFRAARQHLSIFPFSSRVVDAVRDQLTAFELSGERSGSLPRRRCRTRSCGTSSDTGSRRSQAAPAEIKRP